MIQEAIDWAKMLRWRMTVSPTYFCPTCGEVTNGIPCGHRESYCAGYFPKGVLPAILEKSFPESLKSREQEKAQ
jgi:hypothetical protein